MTLPCDIRRFDDETISPVAYDDIEHVQVSKAFLGNPDRYLRELFDGGEEEGNGGRDRD